MAVKYVIIDLLFFHATNALPVLRRRRQPLFRLPVRLSDGLALLRFVQLREVL